MSCVSCRSITTKTTPAERLPQAEIRAMAERIAQTILADRANRPRSSCPAPTELNLANWQSGSDRWTSDLEIWSRENVFLSIRCNFERWSVHRDCTGRKDLSKQEQQAYFTNHAVVELEFPKDQRDFASTVKAYIQNNSIFPPCTCSLSDVPKEETSNWVLYWVDR